MFDRNRRFTRSTGHAPISMCTFSEISTAARVQGTKMEDVDTLTFDPSMKKKKKKKKQDEKQEVVTTVPQPEVVKSEENHESVDEVTTRETRDAPSTEDAVEPAAAPPKQIERTLQATDIETINGDEYVQLLLTGDIDWSKFKKNKRAFDISDDLDSLQFDFSRKKKKKMTEKKQILEAPPSDDEEDEGDVDHEYENLLDNVFNIMRAKNPDLAGSEKKPFIIIPPNVVRLGTKKTGFTNFLQICKMLRRDKDHVLSFLWTELGTSGSIDSSDCLVIKGRYQQRQIESVVRGYIREYVTCHTCKSPNTMLAKQNRLYFLQCEACGSRRTVATIKYGFQANITKRAAIRAKAT
eukprot:gene10577-2700_t